MGHPAWLVLTGWHIHLQDWSWPCDPHLISPVVIWPLTSPTLHSAITSGQGLSSGDTHLPSQTQLFANLTGLCDEGLLEPEKSL